ncbi:DUF4339 domain-containing protein [Hyphomicrobium sp. CS1BSMeth3]|uniref:DUF4339 domain-containing protein n=1 Tax=Hyphomicrobium sp. CS1BSMeth3 TaxID=1892844 RepID=UPI0009308A35|nr:DUF4339 domain-containing protein [Hyphomicrobium sp. CS1BSMeth3]
MNGDWYYATDGDAVGPVTLSDLERMARRGQLRREHLVWTASMSGWEPASSIAELWPAPPPLPPRPQPTPTASQARDAVPSVARPASEEGFQHIGVRHVETADSWPVRHWQGDLPLWKAYWLVGVLLSIAYGAPFNAMFVWLENQPFSRDQVLTIVLSSLALLTAVGVWQLVGIWRSAGNHIHSTNGDWRRFWSVLARIMCVLGGLKIAASVVMALNAIAS